MKNNLPENGSNFVNMVADSGNESVNKAGSWVNLVSKEMDTKTNQIQSSLKNGDTTELLTQVAETILIDPVSWVQKLFNAGKEEYYRLDDDGGNESFMEKRQRLFIEEALREQEKRVNIVSHADLINKNKSQGLSPSL